MTNKNKQFGLRLSDQLIQRAKLSALLNRRSIDTEIAYHLERALPSLETLAGEMLAGSTPASATETAACRAAIPNHNRSRGDTVMAALSNSIPAPECMGIPAAKVDDRSMPLADLVQAYRAHNDLGRSTAADVWLAVEEEAWGEKETAMCGRIRWRM